MPVVPRTGPHPFAKPRIIIGGQLRPQPAAPETAKPEGGPPASAPPVVGDGEPD
jgi:hypothetical protein